MQLVSYIIFSLAPLLYRALSRAGKKVLHLDHNSYYGGSMPCFSASELHELMLRRNDDVADASALSSDGWHGTYMTGQWWYHILLEYLEMRNKTRLYLVKAFHTIMLIRDIGLYHNSPNHLPYNSVHTAFYVPTQHTIM